ncbi:MAG: hypothetical protein WC662_03475 [Candidatus Paceibacterota bacterium]|jgi:hypothetical protein
MIEIKDLLISFNNKLLSEEIKKESIKNIISNIIGFDIKKEKIKIKNETVYLDIKPIYKNEIFLKKELILNKLKETLGVFLPNRFE